MIFSPRPDAPQARRVVHLTTVHTRHDIRIFRKECASLARRWDTHLVVADGKGEETTAGVTIHDTGKPTGRVQRILSSPWKVYRRALRLAADAYHFHDPELIPIALLLRMAGKKVVYDVHEDVPRQILTKPWIRPGLRVLISRMFELLENFAARRFSAIATATPHIRERFVPLNAQTVTLNNFPLQEEIDLGLVSSTPIAGRKRAICYVGGITRVRGIVPLIQAMEHIDATLILAGPMESPAFEQELRGMPGWTRVDYRGSVDRAGVRQIFEESRLGLVLFLPVPNHVSAQPNKMFEYMSAGIPFVGSDFPLWRAIALESNAARVVNPEDPASIATTVNSLLDDPQACQEMGANGLRLVSTTYNWPAQEKILFSLYDHLLTTPRP